MLKSKPPSATDQIDSGQFSLLFDTHTHLEKVGKASVVVLASLFALGLLVTNVYLLQFGLSEFSLLRARFVLTGFIRHHDNHRRGASDSDSWCPLQKGTFHG